RAADEIGVTRRTAVVRLHYLFAGQCDEMLGAVRIVLRLLAVEHPVNFRRLVTAVGSDCCESLVYAARQVGKIVQAAAAAYARTGNATAPVLWPGQPQLEADIAVRESLDAAIRSRGPLRAHRKRLRIKRRRDLGRGDDHCLAAAKRQQTLTLA